MGLWIGLDGNWDWLVFGCCFELVDWHMVGFAFWLGSTYFSPDSTCLLRVLPCARKFTGIGKDAAHFLVLSMVLSHSAMQNDGK